MKKQKTKTAQVVPDVKAPEPPELSRFGTLFTDDIAKRAINKQLDTDETEAVVRLYNSVMHSPMPKTCSNCVSDAFFELYNIWKRDPQHFDDLYNCEYRLRGGVLLQAFGDKSKMATNKTLTNELSEYHLRTNPACSKLFERMPPDWTDRIK
jgi:hypothetical protein